MSETHAVRFTKSWSNYIAGDVATFPIAQARELVGNRVAEPVQQVHPPRPPGEAPTPQRQVASVVRK